jgi:hypothetical protein
VLAASFVVDQHTVGGGHNQVTELTGRKDIGGELLDFVWGFFL